MIARRRIPMIDFNDWMADDENMQLLHEKLNEMTKLEVTLFVCELISTLVPEKYEFKLFMTDDPGGINHPDSLQDCIEVLRQQLREQSERN